ncbi:MAG: FmdB family zinc ribbon protein [Streptosporangiaceae bacterium]
MPTYQYACTDCAAQLEVVQKFTDEPLTVCSTCGGRLRKVFSPVGIVFKGSGFYRTDSRESAKSMVSANGAGKSEKAGADGTAGESREKAGAKAGSSAGAGSSSSTSASSAGSPPASSGSSSSSSASGSKVA